MARFPAYFSSIILPAGTYLFFQKLCRQVRRRPKWSGLTQIRNKIVYTYTCVAVAADIMSVDLTSSIGLVGCCVNPCLHSVLASCNLCSHQNLQAKRQKWYLMTTHLILNVVIITTKLSIVCSMEKWGEPGICLVWAWRNQKIAKICQTNRLRFTYFQATTCSVLGM